jgi:hypothetical protein
VETESPKLVVTAIAVMVAILLVQVLVQPLQLQLAVAELPHLTTTPRQPWHPLSMRIQFWLIPPPFLPTLLLLQSKCLPEKVLATRKLQCLIRMPSRSAMSTIATSLPKTDSCRVD